MEKLLTIGLTILGLIFLTSATPILQDFEESWNEDEARTLARSWDWRNPFGWRWTPQADTTGTTSNFRGVATIGEVNMMTGIFAGGKAVNTIAWCDDRTCTTIRCTNGACSGFTYAASVPSRSQPSIMPVIPESNGMMYVPQIPSSNNIMQANGQSSGNSGTIHSINSHDPGQKTDAEKNDVISGSAQDTIVKPQIANPTNTKEIVVHKDPQATSLQENTSSQNNIPTVVILKENI